MFSFVRSAILFLSLAFCGAASGQTTVVLQQGLNGYAGSADAWLWSGEPDVNASTGQTWNLRTATTAALLKFAIFASEGGPVPDGATITSATLSIYKYSTNDGVFNAKRLLRAWNASQVTWNSAAAGTAWQTAGATGANDVTSAGEAHVTLGSAPGWGDFNVTSAVQAMAGSGNFGWRLQHTGGSTLPHEFGAADDNDATRHPKLAITYTTAAPGTTATLQEGLNSYTGSTDAWLWSGDADANAGSAVTWNLRSPTTAAVLKFAIFASEGGPVPDNATISSATLSVYKFSVNDGVFNARRLLRAWDESQVTWNSAASGSAWQTAGATGTSDVTAAGEAQVTLGSAPAWGDFDVTAAVQAMAGGNNHGWRLQHIGGSTQPHDFGSTENNNAMLRPKLTITYGGPGSIPPVASLGATPSSGDGPLTVTFSAAGSTAGSSPITNLRLQFGHGNPPQAVDWTNPQETKQYTYPAGTASYSATLTVTTNDGTDDDTKVIQVDPSTQEHGSTTPLAPNGEAIPTFHNMSLYFDLASAPTGNRVFVRFRRATDHPDTPGAWKDGLPLWYDERTTNPGCANNNCALPYESSGPVPRTQRVRGSVVNLEPGVKYIFEFGTTAGTWQWHLVGTTWNQTTERSWPDTLVQEGETIAVSSQSGSNLIISDGGSAETGYKVYDGMGTAVIRGRTDGGPSTTDPNSGAISINASYVVLRRVKVDGAWAHAIFIADNVTNVVIEDSELTDFCYVPNGTTAGFTVCGNERGHGVAANNNNSRIVIQRNKIHTPRLGANPWDWQSADANNHPVGANGVFFRHATRQNVVRYNEIYSTAGPVNGVHRQWFMDGIGGTDNFSTKGSPGADSDIYGNIVQNVMDDAIEAEGSGRNVRVWGNYVDQSAIGIATTVAHYGPIYVWRNVVNRLRFRHMSAPDQDSSRARAFKAYGRGGTSAFGGGRQYYFHNTMLQMPGSEWTPDQQFPLGAGGATGGATEPPQGQRHTIFWNNILHIWKDDWNAIRVGAGGEENEYDYDIYNGSIDNSGIPGIYEPNGYRFDSDIDPPLYKAGHGWASVPKLAMQNAGPGIGNYQLDPSSPVGQDGSPAGRRCGKAIPNFNDGSSHQPASGIPDCGAHEQGGPAMKFGVTAGQ